MENGVYHSSQAGKSKERLQDASRKSDSGKTAPLRSGQQKPSNPFIIPKKNQERAEHHRAPVRLPSQTGTHHGATQPGQRPISTAPFEPFQLQEPAAYNYQHSLGRNMFDTKRSSLPTYAPKQTSAPSSIPSSSGQKVTSSTKNIQNFIDLTGDDSSLATALGRKEEFGSIDAYTYMDSAKAQENIKALLEGAFEDEDDKPRTRARRKKLEADINDLAAKLSKVSVGAQDTENAEEEEEEEIDDGTREGLRVKLLPHQIEGVNWMYEKETGQRKTRGVVPKGGILADDMGLGKTVQSIALILTNPKPQAEKRDGKDDDENSGKRKKTKDTLEGVGKGTLIVAPLALIKQWESEIEAKVEESHKLRVCVYHGPGRTKFDSSLKDYDVVITTYGTLSSEHAAVNEVPSRRGLFSVYWYRVILDEAHTIKNRNAKATQAAYALNAHYRWCLTGTPLQNNLDELQSLIRFLRIKPYDDLASWRDQITRPLTNGRGGLAIKRLQVYLKAFMKRRTKDVLNLGESLEQEENGDKDGESTNTSSGFQITKREVVKVQAEFTPAEMSFYNRLQQRTDRRLAQMMGGSKLDYASALVLLLRLRQACNHPDLIKSDLAEDKDVLLNNDNSSSPSKTTKDDEVDDVADLLGGLSVANKKCDICHAELTSTESKSGSSRCGECADLDIDLTAAQKSKKESKRQVTARSKPGSRRNRRVVLDSDDEDEGEWHNVEASEADQEGNRARDVISLASSDDTTADSEDEDNDNEDDLVPSTKIRYLMRILRREAPDYKFIVFSVFTTMLDKIEPFLKRAHIRYARYDGSMKNDLREASLNQLRKDPRTRVLLCSLRAGSLGLNLTAASRVVILEPFWNPVSPPNFAIITADIV